MLNQNVVDDMNSVLPKEIFENIYEKEYKGEQAYHRINQDLNSELETKDSYRGREVLEMLQNAEDQGSKYVLISVNTEKKEILFVNGGIPFSKKGFDAILYAKTSPKIGNLSSIGNKGLGFRSILNWGDQVDIYSRHVHCSFSAEIALKKWDALKENFRKQNQIENLKEVEENLRKQKLSGKVISAPISIFAVPDYESYDSLNFDCLSDISNDFATVIKVRYKDSEEKSILQQIESSLTTETLLFLNNIKQIIVKINGEKRCVSVDSEDSLVKEISKDSGNKIPMRDFLEIKKIKTKDRNDSKEWLVVKETGVYAKESVEMEVYKDDDLYSNSVVESVQIEKKYQVGVAVNISEFNASKTNPLFSYFATQVNTGLPCILHGTFFLSPDRKHLEDNNEYNKWLQNRIGERLCSFAEYLASNQQKLGLDKWLPYDILCFKAAPSNSLETLKNYLNANWSLTCVLPTLNDNYKKKEHVCWYSEEFANLIFNEKDYIESGFGNHLIPDFSKHIEGSQLDANFAEKIDAVSKKINQKYDCVEENYDHRIALLDALKNANYQCENKFKLGIVVDENKNLLIPNAESKIYVNTGVQINNPPAVLKFRYVSKKMVELLKAKWSTDDRGVTSILQKYIDITPADIALIKQKVSNVLYEEPEENDYKAIIKSLFRTSDLHFLTRCTIDGISFEPYDNDVDALFLMAQDGHYYPASSMILEDDTDGNNQNFYGKIGKRWKIFEKVSEWMNILGTEDSNAVKKFFISTLGVSECVPKKPVGVKKDDCAIANAFDGTLKAVTYHYFNEKIKDYRQWNVAYVPDVEFLSELRNEAHLSLDDIFAVIMRDSLARKSLLNNKLYYSLNTVIYNETMDYGYSAKMLRPFFESEFKNIIVSNRKDLVSSIAESSQSTESDVENGLVYLGAFRTEEDLSMEGLYQRMADVAERILEGKRLSVQTEYKKIRELIKKRKDRHPEEIPEIPGYLSNRSLRFVVKHENRQKVVSARDVYYWDNDKFPKKILDKYPKLMIGSRVGEDSVKEIFGVKLMKNVSFTILPTSKINENLTHSIKMNLIERFPFLLAVRCADADSLANKKLFSDALMGMEITGYTECEYTECENSESTNVGESNRMEIGDLLVDNETKCHICSTADDYESAVKDPKFCESLVEFLCIKLMAAESNWFDAIRTVIKNSKTENNYYLKREYPEKSYWSEINKALGLPKDESDFWNVVTKELGKTPLESDSLVDRGKRLAYIEETFDVSLRSRFREKLPMIDAMSGDDQLWLLKTLGVKRIDSLDNTEKIKDLYKEWLDSLRNNYSRAYFAYLRKQITLNIGNQPNEVESFLKKVEDFKSNDIFVNIPNECQENLYNYTEFKKLVREKIQAVLPVQCDDLDTLKEESSDILPQYEAILAEYNRTKDSLEPEIMTYAYFDGFEEVFTKKIKEKNCETDEKKQLESETGITEKKVDSTKVQGSLVFLDSGKWTSGDSSVAGRSARKSHSKQGPFADSRTLAQKGRKAEQIVRDKFNESSDYKIVNEWSTNLNPSGDNGKHRDLDYKIANKPDEIRYLEIKSSSNGQFIMSSGEYEFATNKDNVDKYDIALVDDEENVTVLKSPFKNDKLSLKPDSYVGKVSVIEG